MGHLKRLLGTLQFARCTFDFYYCQRSDGLQSTPPQPPSHSMPSYTIREGTFNRIIPIGTCPTHYIRHPSDHDDTLTLCFTLLAVDYARNQHHHPILCHVWVNHKYTLFANTHPPIICCGFRLTYTFKSDSENQRDTTPFPYTPFANI